ncbi:putative membrane protein [Devosia subaequoris]|uniref:Putative membrane protein n=1 Tax=Devosia subaequoris TaxID=395930 RepID=A0A7W6NBW3_9HYPH|nr:cytochrome c oxidase assembly protein [Devosia subaequoris]MBB4052989.1 putative membrane protein [Devosia subaequoris]MCP1210408.1 cytochrome c oxidase assembly protein [Devosia subaequoris]
MDPASAFSFDMSYCGSPPTLETLWGRWNFEPVLLGALVLTALAGFALLRQAGQRRQLAFASAWLLAVLLFVSPVCALSVALFSVRVGHHVVLTMVLAPLLALALPARWGARASLMPPLVLSTLSFWLWHAPDFYTSAFTHPALYWLMQASLIASFTWLWMGLLRSNAATVAGIAALSSAIQMGLLGALLVFAPAPLYLPHLGNTMAFGLLPLEDQQLAGLLMWVPANLPLLALVLWRLVTVLRAEQAVAE